jgi:hypothetical protein
MGADVVVKFPKESTYCVYSSTLTPALDGSEWSASRRGRFDLGEISAVHTEE